MVDIAQQVEHLIVVQKVARSNRVIHPTRLLSDGKSDRELSTIPLRGYSLSLWIYITVHPYVVGLVCPEVKLLGPHERLKSVCLRYSSRSTHGPRNEENGYAVF